jgi:hypothetical protein
MRCRAVWVWASIRKQFRGRNRRSLTNTSVQRLTRRMTCDDRSHSCSFAELITEPSPFLRLFDFLKSQPNGLAENLSYALLGCARRAVMRNARAKLRHHRLERFLGFCVHSEFCFSPIEASSAVKPNTYNLKWTVSPVQPLPSIPLKETILQLFLSAPRFDSRDALQRGRASEAMFLRLREHTFPSTHGAR